MLQAENQEEMRDWIYCLQTTAQDAIYSHQSTMFNANSSDQFQVYIFFKKNLFKTELLHIFLID